jgi:hypothetical protein
VIVGGNIDRKDNPQTWDLSEFAYVRRIAQESGDVTWEKLFGSNSLNRVRSLAADGNGNVYAAGYAYSDVGAGHVGEGDVFVIKLAVADGAVKWTRGFGTPAMEVAHSVAVAPDGNVMIGGYTAGALAGNRVATGNGSDTFAFKLSSVDGSVLWQTQFGPGGGWGLAVDAAGDAIVVGAANLTVPNPEGAGTFTVRKLSGANGSAIWTQRFGTDSNDWARGVAVDPSDDVLVTGAHDTQSAVMKLDGSDGSPLWVQHVGSMDVFSDPAIAATASGTVLFTGTASGDLDGEGEQDGGFLYELDGSDGSVAWLEQFGVRYRENCRATAMDSAGNLWVTGLRDVDRTVPANGSTRRNSFVAKIVRE